MWRGFSLPTSKTAFPYLSIDGKAVEQAVASGALQIFLAAASGAMRRVPRGGILTATRAVVVAHSGTAFTVARPILAGCVLTARRRCSVQLRTGQDVVPVGTIPPAINHLSQFVQLGFFGEIVTV